MPKSEEPSPIEGQGSDPAQEMPSQVPSMPKGGSGVKESKVSDRILADELRRRGIKIPKVLQNSVIKKSKKGAAGQLVLRRISGVDRSPARDLVNEFEKNVGGKEDVAEKLSAVKDVLPEGVGKVLELLRSDPKMRLPRVIAEVGADVAQVMTWYAKGAIFLGQVESAIEAHRNMPRVVKDLVGHALDQEGLCSLCYGTGGVSGSAGGKTENQVCPLCRGEKVSLTSSKHKEFAVQKLLEITKMVEKSPLVSVNQQVGVKVEGGGTGALSKIASLADEILYGRKALPEAQEVEAIVVKNG